MTASNTSTIHPDPQRTTTGRLRWSGRDWASLALLAVLVTLFFWRIVTPNLGDRASFPPGDFPHQFWAFSTFEVRELSAGRLPLWNPHTYGGAPFWADIQSAVLYPPSLLTLLLSGVWGFSLFALELEAIAHFWLAATFTYLFVRRLTYHRGAALFAAVTFTFGGYLTGYPSQQLAVLETDVWLPLLLYFSDRALIDRSAETPQLRVSLPGVLSAGLVWGVALLAGHPQSAMFLIYSFALYALFLIFAWRKRPSGVPAHPLTGRPARPGPHIRYALLAPILILLIGLGLSAVAWLPGLEYLRLSVRAAGFYDKMSGGFPLYDSIQLLLPGSVSFYSPLYVGVLPLLLAVWVALTRRQRETTFWGALSLGAFLLSFGGETILYTPFYLFAPGFSLFRGQERAAFLVSFALAVLSGYGFKYQLSTNKSKTLDFKSAAGWLLVGAIGLDILFFYALNSAGWQDTSPFNALLDQSIWLTLMLMLIWGVKQVGGYWNRKGGRADPRKEPTRGLKRASNTLLGICFLLIVTLDLFTVNWKTNIYPSLPEEHTSVPGVVQAIRQDALSDEVFRVYNEFRIYENYGMPYELEDTWGASPLRLARYDELHRSLRMERVWELLNVKYVITWRKELYAPSQIIFQETIEDEDTYVHRLNQVAPRAWLVYQVQEVDEGETLSVLDAFDTNPAQKALVPPGSSLPIQATPGAESELDTGQVKFIGRTPTSMHLDVTAPTHGLLVLSEIYYPGWRARVDGQPASLARVDYVLRGVPVPPGTHHLEVFYRPVTFLWGAIISGATLVILAVLGLRVRRGRGSPIETDTYRS